MSLCLRKMTATDRLQLAPERRAAAANLRCQLTHGHTGRWHEAPLQVHVGDRVRSVEVRWPVVRPHR